MNLNQLRQFIILSEELNYRKAARRLQMGQSPLSQSIRRLEDLLQAQLFERSRHDVRLTPAGLALACEAELIFRNVAFAQRLVVLADAPFASELVIGFTGSELNTLVPAVVDACRRRCSAPIRVWQGSADAQFERILTGEIDIGLVHPPPAVPDDIECRIAERIRLVAAVPSAWPVADLKQLTLRTISTLPLILFPQADQPALHARLHDAFAAARCEAKVHHEAASVTARLKLVAAGYGVSFVPSTATLEAVEGVTLRVVTDLPGDIQMDVNFAWHRAAMPARREVFAAVADELSW